MTQLCIHSTDVSVSLPTAMRVGEGEEMMEVCATLSVMADTERYFTVLIFIEDSTGKNM